MCLVRLTFWCCIVIAWLLDMIHAGQPSIIVTAQQLRLIGCLFNNKVQANYKDPTKPLHCGRILIISRISTQRTGNVENAFTSWVDFLPWRWHICLPYGIQVAEKARRPVGETFYHDVGEISDVGLSEALNLVMWWVRVMQPTTPSFWRRGRSWLQFNVQENGSMKCH